jgi:hypothetical protein
MADEAGFRAAFDRWSRRVRGRLATRSVLTGLALGLLVGGAAAGIAWKTRHGALRPVAASLGVIGAGLGYAVARRKRWSDNSVALFLDAKLASNEAITTAIELSKGEVAARDVVLASAKEALDRAAPKQARPPLWRGLHALAPLGAGAIGLASFMPIPPPPLSSLPPPGVERVKLAKVEGLDKAMKLADAKARDAAQRERLKKIAEEAKKLQDKLRDGMEKREAQSDLAKLRDDIAAERLSLAKPEERQGLESALGKLGEDPHLDQAKRALGDGDVASLDDEMERLADSLEKKDRERAEKLLQEAADQARKDKAEAVAKALEDEKKRLHDKGEQADALKELAKELGDGLGEEGKRALEDVGKTGNPKDLKKLEKELAKALEKLTPEQRKRLAEKMKKQLERAGPSGGSKEQQKKLAEDLDTEEGRKQLEDELKKMAEAPDEGTEEGERQGELGDAQKGLDDAQGELGGMPMPMPGQPNGGPPKNGKGPSDPSANGDPKPGHSDGEGPGSHDGHTNKIDGGDVKSQARAKINKAHAMPGTGVGRTSARPGETANTAGTGALGDAAAQEVGGVDRSDVPEEYREQVGRYFQPR